MSVARDNARGPGRAEKYSGWVGICIVAGQMVNRTMVGCRFRIHTIFEGTSEIQQLVIARAISGLRIE